MGRFRWQRWRAAAWSQGDSRRLTVMMHARTPVRGAQAAGWAS